MQRTKGGGIQGTPTIFSFLLHNFTNLCFPLQDPPPPDTKTCPNGHVLVFGGLSHLLDTQQVPSWASATCLFDQARWTRRFWHVCRIFSSSSSPHLTSPLPHLPTLQTTLQTRCRCPFGHLQHIFFTTHDKHADFGMSVAFSCVPSRQT